MTYLETETHVRFNSTIPATALHIPTVGTSHSHRGNITFPYWEHDVPTVGTNGLPPPFATTYL
jgi:hypothetical protein